MSPEKFDLKAWLTGFALGLAGKPLPLSMEKREPVAYLYNGVRLPALPEWDKEKYPYAVLSFNYGTNGGEPSSVMLYVLADATHGYNQYGNWSVPSSGYFGWFADRPTTWGEFVLSDSNPAVSLLDWANFNLLNEDGTLYLAASDPVPVYE